jgi:peptidoglycan hydrolase-like protein with peptidoglycan-binding domain
MAEYIAKKGATFIVALALVVGSFGMPAQAQTTTNAQLQAQINALLAQIALLQAQIAGGGQATTGRCAFTRDLTIGSQGSDVTCLQTYLQARGHYTFSGGATGYFGPITQAAVARWQAANGVSPAAGYFGPLSRAKYNAIVVVVTPNPTTPDDDDDDDNDGPLEGGEGQLINIDNLGDVESSIEEGDEDEQVLGLEMEADDSDIMIERVDVEFTKGGTDNGSDNLDDYLTEVSLWLDGEELARMDVDEADEDDDVWSFRFTGLDGIIREADMGELYVAVTAANSIDSDDEGDTWTVDIPNDGIRAIDAEDISETYDGADAETITFVEASLGDLTLREADDSPEASVVIADEDDDTEEVVILGFELEAEDQEIMVNDIPVTLVTSENEGVEGVVSRVMLMQDDDVLDTVSIPASATTTHTVVFEDLDLTIGADETEEFWVAVDVNDIDATTFATGTTLYAEIDGDDGDWDVEDENGEEITPDGSITGEEFTFETGGVMADFVSSSASRSFTADDTGESDVGTYRIVFDVTALEEDMWIDRSVTQDPDRNGVGGAGTGIQWATTTDTTATVTVTGAVVSASDTDNDDTSSAFKIDEGDTRRFTLTVNLEADTSGFAGVQLTGINWDTDSTVGSNFYVSNLDEFRTELLSLSVR